jgi:hypothetical protein
MKLHKHYQRLGKLCLLAALCASCKAINLTEQLPADTYTIPAVQYNQLPGATGSNAADSAGKISVDVLQEDTLLNLAPNSGTQRPLHINMTAINHLQLKRVTFDLDVLTIPFKIRPSVAGFPEQLNANFNAAMYFGRRVDRFTIETDRKGRSAKTHLRGTGYGYGGFIGLGSEAVNPYVTRQRIDYEYDGFVINGGVAGIYDAKRFNLGLALGADFLIDRNRRDWIYQGKPWIGVLFGINLN